MPAAESAPPSRLGPFLARFAVVALAVPLVPFAVFGELPGVAWATNPDPAYVFVVGALLLAGDVFLPIPSSVLAVFLGAQLGLVGGALAVVLGLTLGSGIGYAAGRIGGRPLVRRFTSGSQQASLQALEGRWGYVSLALLRSVPVLSEASVLAAGAARWAAGPTLGVLVVANAVLGTLYAAFGATGMAEGSPTLLFVGGLVVPAVGSLAVLLALRAGRRSGERVAEAG